MNIPSLVYQGLIFLLGAMASAAINHFLNKDRERQIHKIISFHTAAEKFRHSFDDALLDIDQREHPVTNLLREFFISHKVAMWHFKYYFTGRTRERFKETWNNYEQFYNENYENGSVFAQFASAQTDCENQKRDEFRQYIENLLKFTI